MGDDIDLLSKATIAIKNKKYKVCLDYHLKKCDGPCEGLQKEIDYNKNIISIKNLLKGKYSNVIKELLTNEVVIPGIPVTDTIKVVKNSQIQETLARDQLRAVQTPQGFSKQVLNRVYNTLTDIGSYTDEASMTEAIGVNGVITTGCHKNIKITHKDDIAFLNFLNTH